ncbi:MAG: error-prone DNA polymerase [Chlamydiales bacterium]|nr:error-prone DNA polymerase [Chlamydiales bacterium]
MVFTELYCRSYFSFLEGASSPEALAHRAAELALPALALADRNGLYGALAFYRACKSVGVKPIIGAQLTIEGGDEIVVLCTDMKGYTQLSLLLTEAHRGRSKGDPLVRKHHLHQLRGGVICLLGGKIGLLPTMLVENNGVAAKRLVEGYREIFGDVYLMLTHQHDAGDKLLCQRTSTLAKELDIPIVASNAVCYTKSEEGILHDALLCIKNHTTLNESHHYRPGNHQRYLKSPEAMSRLFHDYPGAIANTSVIAERCNVILDFSSYRVPEFTGMPVGHTVDSYLEELCRQRLITRYNPITEQIQQKIDDELALIKKLNLSGYFLVVWDIVEYARSLGIPVQGRGSAANSLVAYVLGITPVDPVAHRLFLGRFIHEGMTEAPDIDLDFASAREEGIPDREDIIQYVYRRYGEDHVAMVCTYITFQVRSAIREVGKVLEIPDETLDPIAKMFSSYGGREKIPLAPEGDTRPPEFWQLFEHLVTSLLDIPRHISIHTGGMVIASRPIAELVPLEPARMEGRVVCQWDKDMVSDAGLIKVDILGLGMLAVLREAQKLCGDSIDLFSLPLNDSKIYDNISRADTVGLFQVESRAQMQSLPRVRPRNFDELGVQVALIRPGPLQGNMVSPYIKRKQGDEAVTYIHPSLKPVLEDTLGVILFQEQVLMVAVAIANFSPSQAADLRRAMSRKRSKEAMQRLKEVFLEGSKNNKIPTIQAEAVFNALEGFALYGFCKSHALAFARITYVSAWLKEYRPAAFLAALLNNQPMGFYPCKTLIDDARRHGVESLPVDVNASRPRCHVADEANVQLGFIMVKGAEGAVAKTIMRVREDGPFVSLRDFVLRTRLTKLAVERLIQAGAFDSFGLERRELLWQLWLLQRVGLFLDDLFADQEIVAPPLPASDAWDLIRGEYHAQGFSAQRHPMALLRDQLNSQGIVPSKALIDVPEESHICVAGVVVCRQKPPTAKGFAFLTIEDEFGMMNVIINPKLYEKVRPAFRQSPLVRVRGVRNERDGIINIKATDMSAL